MQRFRNRKEGFILPAEERIHVLLVDDQVMIRQGFGYVIGLQNDMKLSGEATNGKEAVEMALKSQPDVILMDIQMPSMSGIEATEEIMKRLPQTKIVILTTFDDQEYIYQGIRTGAVGYLLKDADVEDMLDAIRSAFRGEAVYRTSLAASALSRIATGTYFVFQEKQSPSSFESLTEREQEI